MGEDLPARDRHTTLPEHVRARARQRLAALGALDLVPMLGLDDAPLATSEHHQRRYGRLTAGDR